MSKIENKLDNEQGDNPFEEFDSKDVVNKDELSPYSFDMEFDKAEIANKNSTDESEQWLTDEDLTDFVKYGNEAKKAANLYKSLVEEPFESSVIKKAEAAKKKIISASDIEDILNYDEDQRKQEHFNDEYKSEKTSEIENKAFLVKNFRDFIIAPKISGAKAGPKHKNLIPEEYYTDKGTIVEIVDDPAMIAEEHRTQIEINRNKEGEIESILVTCKCGEKTFVQFDYVDDEENNETEYHSFTPEVEELDMMPRKKSSIAIPDDVIQEVIDEVEDDEEKRAKPFEGEV